MSELLTQLRVEHDRLDAAWKAGDPLARLRAGRAYDKWFHQACLEGRPPDALSPWISDEYDRFMSKTLPGPNGHLYWHLRKQQFKMNDGREMASRKWLWIYTYGPIPRGSVEPTCGESQCHNPQHCRFVSWGEKRRQYTPDQSRGMIRMAASRLGRAPSLYEYAEMGYKPSWSTIRGQFGTWNKAIIAAGLDPANIPHESHTQKWSDSDIVVALRSYHDKHGCAPTVGVWEGQKLEPSYTTIKRRFGGFQQALALAGLKSNAIAPHSNGK